MIRKIFLLFFFFVIFSFVSADIVSINNGGDLGLVITPNQLINGFFFNVGTDTPHDPNPVLVSVDGSNSPNSNLNCSSLIYDNDTSLLNISVGWYKDGNLEFTILYSLHANGTTLSSTISNGLLSVGDVWQCRMQITDGLSDSNLISSNSLTIVEADDDSGGDSGGGGGGGGGSGGGGGGGASPGSGSISGDSLEIEPELFTLIMKKGTYYRKPVKVMNTGTTELNVFIFIEDLDRFMFPDNRSFTLSPGENKTVNFDVYVSERTFSDIYLGRILFKTNTLSVYSDVVLDVDEKDALFDIRTEVLKKYIYPGGRILANVSLINFGTLRNFDVELEYKIIDFENNVYTIKKEDFAINKTYNNVFYLDVPKDIPLGNFVFYTKVLYPLGNVTASSFDTFTTERISIWSWIILIIVLLILMIISIIKYREKLYATYEKWRARVMNEKEKSAPIDKVKLDVANKGIPKLPDFLEE